MKDSPSLTRTEILAAADRVLVSSGYRRLPETLETEEALDGRAYEDVYGLVLVSVFDFVQNLMDNWHESQGSLVSLMTRFISAQEAKAWDGYLVLLTPEHHTPSHLPRSSPSAGTPIACVSWWRREAAFAHYPTSHLPSSPCFLWKC